MEDGIEAVDLIKFNTIPENSHYRRFDESPIIVDVKHSYIVTNADSSVYKFNTMSDIAFIYSTNVSNIKHMVDKKKVKGLHFSIVAEEYPYTYKFKNVEYQARHIKDIAQVTGRSISYIHSLITKFIKNRQ